MSWDGAHPIDTLEIPDHGGGISRFQVRIEPLSDNSFHYHVRPLDGEFTDSTEFFAFAVPFQNGLRLEGATNNLPPAYRSIGIYGALIPALARHHDVPMFSSKHSPASGETRTESASKSWERLVGRGIARYDSAADRYVVEPPSRERGA